MNESEKKNRLEKVAREIYPNIRRNAKLNVHAIELIIRYFKWVRNIEPDKMIDKMMNSMFSHPDLSKYERKLAKYKKELGFRNPNVIVMTVYTQLVAENSYTDLINILGHVKNFKIKERLRSYMFNNCPSYESIDSSFDLFRKTAMDGQLVKDINTNTILSYMESFMIMDNIRTYSESKDIDEVRYKWAGRVYIKEINFPYLGEKKYTVNMDVNIRSRYISEVMGVKICKKLIGRLSDLDHMSNEYGSIMTRLDSIISGDRSMNEPYDIITISSSHQNNPSDLIALVGNMKSIMTDITKIDFKSQDIDSEELNELIKELKS